MSKGTGPGCREDLETTVIFDKDMVGHGDPLPSQVVLLDPGSVLRLRGDDTRDFNGSSPSDFLIH